MAVRAKSLTIFRSLKPADGACKDVPNGWRQMVNIIVGQHFSQEKVI